MKFVCFFFTEFILSVNAKCSLCYRKRVYELAVRYNISEDGSVKCIRTLRHVVLRVNHSGGHTIDNVQPMCEGSRMSHLKCACAGERVKYHLKVCAGIYFSSE